MAISAISGPYGNDEYHILNDERREGVYNSEGVKLRGEDVGETQEQIAYLIWRQKQSPRHGEAALRVMYRKLKQGE